jgi:hypothetical protein
MFLNVIIFVAGERFNIFQVAEIYNVKLCARWFYMVILKEWEWVSYGL